MWIRDVFLRSDADHGAVVVHGHTPVAAPEMRRNRIGIDTGAYATGVLTALVLEGEERRFLATGGA
jgi:serine/threonine protein phosphatase 1